MKRRYLHIAMLACIVSANGFAQPTIKTQRVFGGSSSDVLVSMYLTKDGGYILGGSSRSGISGEKTENNRGGWDYWIVKLDSLEQVQWDKTIGGSNDDVLTSISLTKDDGYILGGYSYSNKSGEKTENTRGKYDYWVVKLDSLGHIQWDKTIGGNKGDELTSLQQTIDGGYILGGLSDSKISGEKTEKSRGDFDYWLVKLKSDGKIQWDKTIGGDGYDGLSSLQQTADGGYILGGSSESNISGEKTENSRGGHDYWVVKLDGLANIQWDKTIGGSGWDQLTSLLQTSDGGYILGGYSESNISGEKTEHSRGSWDYWAIKVDGSGNIQWDKTIGGSNLDQLNSIQPTSDSGYILGGYSYSNISGEKTENSRGNSDYWAVKLKSNGKVQWDKTIGGTGNDELFSIKELGENRYMLGGRSTSRTTGDKKRQTEGFYDYWLVKLFYKTGSQPLTNTTRNIASAITSPGTISKSFFLSPNPAKSILYVQSKGNTVFSLINQSGKTILTKTIENSGSINIAQLPAGLYYVKNNNTGEVQKIVIER